MSRESTPLPASSPDNPSNLSRRSFLGLLGFTGAATLAGNVLAQSSSPNYRIESRVGGMGDFCRRDIVRDAQSRPIANVFYPDFTPDAAGKRASAFILTGSNPDVRRVFPEKGVKLDPLTGYYKQYNGRRPILALAGAFVGSDPKKEGVGSDPKKEGELVTEGILMIDGVDHTRIEKPDFSGFLVIEGGFPRIVFASTDHEQSHLREKAKKEKLTLLQTMTILKDGVQQKLIVKGTQQFRFFMTKNDGNSAVVTFSKPVTLEDARKVLESVGAKDAIYLDCGGNESGAFWDEKKEKIPLGENGSGHYDNLLVIHVPGK